MANDAERFEKLRSFPLSQYAARSYLALLDLGETEARDISRLARIPLAKVYGVLEALQAKGLCEIFPGTPKRYAPVPIESYVARVVNEQKRSAAALEAQVEELMTLFPVRAGRTLSDRGRIQTLTGRRSAVEYESKLIVGARQRLVMLCTPGRVARLRKMLPELKEARERGVEVRMLIPNGDNVGKDFATFSPYAEVRLRAYDERARSSSVSFASSENAGLIIDHIPDAASMRDGDDVGLQIGNEGIVSALHDLLGHAWANAPSLATPRVRRDG